MGERSSQLGKSSGDNECHGEERNSGVSVRGVKIYIMYYLQYLAVSISIWYFDAHVASACDRD